MLDIYVYLCVYVCTGSRAGIADRARMDNLAGPAWITDLRAVLGRDLSTWAGTAWRD
jgi:hypothetical protein